jgi:hypothetical protein
MTAESARDDDLRLLEQAGFGNPNLGMQLKDAVHIDPRLFKLIALARQRPGWVWVPDDPNKMPLFAHGIAASTWKSLLAAAPKPGDGV